MGEARRIGPSDGRVLFEHRQFAFERGENVQRRVHDLGRDVRLPDQQGEIGGGRLGDAIMNKAKQIGEAVGVRWRPP